MKQQFNLLHTSRVLTLKAIRNLTIEQINFIPKNFKNNIGWNLAHLVVTQQLLCYKLSNLPCLINDDFINRFQKGTVPNQSISPKEFDYIKEQLIVLPKQTEVDFEKGVFKEFIPYETSVKYTLNNFEAALSFNNYHEGIHLGIVLQLMKFV